MNDTLKRPALHLLVVITNTVDAKKTDSLLRKAALPLQYRCNGEGTASSEALDLLGIGSSDKIITICVAPKVAVHKLVKVLSNELDLHKPGHGIVFSVPMSGVSNPVLQIMDVNRCNEIGKHIEREGEHMAENSAFSLVLAAVNQGYSEEVMETAKENGAMGGTVIHARRLGMEETFKFWGISLQSEKEIIAILVPKEKRIPLMKSLGENHGMKTEAHGMILSLPVDSVAGIQEVL